MLPNLLVMIERANHPAPGRFAPRQLRLALSAGTVRRRLVAALCGLACMVFGLSRPTAQASLETADGRDTLHEARLVHDVAIRGVVASVKSTQLIVNASKQPQEAVYTFDLPLHAAITGLSIRLADGRTSSATVVDANAAIKTPQDPGGIAASPDLGLLRMVARDKPHIDAHSLYARTTYELRVYPVAPGQVTTATISWVAPLHYDGGRLSLRIPQRGGAGNLVREQVALTLSPPPGARGFASVHGGGKLLGKRIRRARFTALPRTDIVIEAVPDLALGLAQPSVSFAAAPIRNGFGALAISVLSPPPRGRVGLQYERALLVVDVSRSMGPDGLAAANHIASGLVASLPALADVEMVLFDREARRVFGEWSKNNSITRKTIAGALRPGDLRNGSNLGAALDLAHSILDREPIASRPAEGFERGVRASTLIAIISDGMTPLGLSGKAAIDRLGDDVLRDIEIAAVFLTPDSAPIPDTTRGAMAALAQKTRGRAIATRFGDAARRVRKLSAELNRPAPFTALSVQATAATIEGIALPRRLEPGQGTVALGFYRGQIPKHLHLHVEQHGKSQKIAAKRDSGLRRAGLALALAAATEDDFLEPGELDATDSQSDSDKQIIEEARRGLIRAASQASTVTRYSSMIGLDATDRYARDRLQGVKKWGPFAFSRLPPPQRKPNYQLRQFAESHDDDEELGRNSGRRTGELDRNIIERLISTYVVPKAEVCYENELRKNPNLRGSLTVVIEIARGEVQEASVAKSTFASGSIEGCIETAAYTIQVPRVALGDDPETIGVARYPMSFRRRDGRGEVQLGVPGQKSVADPTRVSDPLGGLEDLDR
ncbi:MAG: AgmX/PglI C-terminal domain-containing protein [Proteobacteria bacterium]|nr:AgmX/PglI C-terminal domain-containing protein [Pseudomonadota bacterium]